MFWSGAKLMVIGMTIVFLFLALLVWVIGATARAVRLYEPDQVATLRPGGLTPTDLLDTELAAAIAVAVQRFRRQSG
jgi:oxaloacetate decarboxylase gamma subunit